MGTAPPRYAFGKYLQYIQNIDIIVLTGNIFTNYFFLFFHFVAAEFFFPALLKCTFFFSLFIY